MSDTYATDHAVLSTRSVVGEINRAHGLRFTLGARCRGGLQGGAWILVDPGGRQAVLKWRADDPTSRRPRLLDMVNRIRAADYPTPKWIAAGVTSTAASYHVQDFVPGEPASLATSASAARLIDVLERQAGLDPDLAHDWSRYVKSCALEEDGDGPRRFLRGMGQPGVDLIAHFDRVLALHGPVHLPADDLVHGDFNSCNVLMHDGRVSGVIDIEALGSGTRAVDYGWLLREAYVEGASTEAIRLIRQAGQAVAGPEALALCVTATAFDIVRFQVQHDDAREVPGILARLHQLADDLSVSL